MATKTPGLDRLLPGMGMGSRGRGWTSQTEEVKTGQSLWKEGRNPALPLFQVPCQMLPMKPHF